MMFKYSSSTTCHSDDSVSVTVGWTVMKCSCSPQDELWGERFNLSRTFLCRRHRELVEMSRSKQTNSLTGPRDVTLVSERRQLVLRCRMLLPVCLGF